MRRIGVRKGPPEKLDPWAAACLSTFVLPGGGQIYNGQKKKGIVLMILTFGAFLAAAIQLFLFFLGYIRQRSAVINDIDNLATEPRLEVPASLWALLLFALLVHLVTAADAWWVSHRQYKQRLAAEAKEAAAPPDAPGPRPEAEEETDGAA